MRPQLGSAPWTAVLTSGELAIVRATCRASSLGARVAHVHGDELRRPLAAADDAQGELARHGEQPFEQRRVRLVVDDDAAGAGASAIRQSLVEHSPSTVIALNVSRADSSSARRRSAGGICASVVRKPSIVAMFGSIIPAPLAVPPTVNVPAAVCTLPRAPLETDRSS